MEIYLPIAQMSVRWLVLLAMGGGVGFLSGMFGVGGGFLLTPLLIFYGIPAEVAVATTASHLTASSMAGAIAQWKNRVIDFRMAGVMLAGGVAGSLLGVQLLALLRRLGQADVVISAGYVILLGSIGSLMLSESWRALRAAKAATPRPAPERHNWIHALPLKMRFYTSRLYISAIPPIVLGIVVGVLSSILGVGGGFVIVPVLTLWLDVPFRRAVATSLVIITITGCSALASHLLAGSRPDLGVTLTLAVATGAGALLGTQVAERLPQAFLRRGFALLVAAVALALLIDTLT